MNPTFRNGAANGLNDALFTLMLASLLGLMIGLGFGAFGLQHFGSRSQILCRVSAGLLVPLVAVRLLGHLKAKRTSYVRADLAIFLLPLVLLPCAANIAGGASLAMGKSLAPAASNAQTAARLPQAVINPLTGKAENGRSATVGQTPAVATSTGGIPGTGPITLTPGNYEEVYGALYGRPEEFAGRDIVMDGFAIPDKTLPDNQWLIGRLLIVCCPGDGILVGFPARMPKDFKPSGTGSWWQVEGKLETQVIPPATSSGDDSQFSAGERVPCIAVTAIRAKPMPDDPYLYPQ